MYLDAGLVVIPSQKGIKGSYESWKQFQETPPTEEQISGWFHDDGNLSIVCGKVSGDLIVVDIDDISLFDKIFPPDTEIMSKTLVVKSARGYHVYVKCSDTTGHSNYKGMEVLGEKHLVTAPPSIHPTGIEYKIVSTCKQINRNDNMQEHVLNKVKELGLLKNPDQQGIPHFKELYPCVRAVILSGSKEGERNEVGFRLVNLLRATKKYDANEIGEILTIWNSNNKPPLTHAEMLAISGGKTQYGISCEKLRESQSFAVACFSENCNRKGKYKPKKDGATPEIISVLFDQILKMVLYSNTEEAYVDFIMRDDKHLEIKVKDIMTSKAFADSYLKIYNDFSWYFQIRKLDEDEWEQFLVKLNREKFIASNEVVDEKNLAVEILLQKIQDLDIVTTLDNAVYGGGGILSAEDEMWLSVSVIKKILDRENIRIPFIEISKGMKRYKKRHHQRRIGQKIFNGWVLDAELLGLEPPEADDEPKKPAQPQHEESHKDSNYDSHPFEPPETMQDEAEQLTIEDA